MPPSHCSILTGILLRFTMVTNAVIKFGWIPMEKSVGEIAL